MLASLLLLTQATLTPEALVDDLCARYGYGVVGTSAAERKPLVLPHLENALDTEVRLKNLWRVERDKAMPGVFRPQVAPYAEAFEETGPGIPSLQGKKRVKDKDGISQVVSVEWRTAAPKTEPLPIVELADFGRPGGVQVSVERLAALLGSKPEAVPWVYRNRTALVRLDPRRSPKPLALLAAIVGARIKDDALAFDPRSFRRLAVETLRAEARRGKREDAEVVQKHILAYEEDRPFRLRLGAEGIRAASDGDLSDLYRDRKQGWPAPIPGFDRTFPGAASARRDLALVKFRQAYASNLELMPRLDPHVPPQVAVASPSGLGTLVWPTVGGTLLWIPM